MSVWLNPIMFPGGVSPVPQAVLKRFSCNCTSEGLAQDVVAQLLTNYHVLSSVPALRMSVVTDGL